MSTFFISAAAVLVAVVCVNEVNDLKDTVIDLRKRNASLQGQATAMSNELACLRKRITECEAHDAD